MFEYLFYRIYWWNKVVVKERDLLIFSSLLGISAFKIMNLSTIILAILIYTGDNVGYPKWIQIVLMLSVVLCDYFIYIKDARYKIIVEKFSKNNDLKIKDLFLILYIVLTFILYLLVGVIGSKTPR